MTNWKVEVTKVVVVEAETEGLAIDMVLAQTPGLENCAVRVERPGIDLDKMRELKERGELPF